MSRLPRRDAIIRTHENRVNVLIERSFAEILRFFSIGALSSLRRFVRRHEKEHLIVPSAIDIEYYQDQYLEMAVFASDT